MSYDGGSNFGFPVLPLTFAAATHCEPARLHYRRRREHGDRHGAANRHLFNKLLGQLYQCLQHGHAFDEAKAFPRPALEAA